MNQINHLHNSYNAYNLEARTLKYTDLLRETRISTKTRENLISICEIFFHQATLIQSGQEVGDSA